MPDTCLPNCFHSARLRAVGLYSVHRQTASQERLDNYALVQGLAARWLAGGMWGRHPHPARRRPSVWCPSLPCSTSRPTRPPTPPAAATLCGTTLASSICWCTGATDIASGTPRTRGHVLRCAGVLSPTWTRLPSTPRRKPWCLCVPFVDGAPPTHAPSHTPRTRWADKQAWRRVVPAAWQHGRFRIRQSSRNRFVYCASLLRTFGYRGGVFDKYFTVPRLASLAMVRAGTLTYLCKYGSVPPHRMGYQCTQGYF